MNNNAQPHEALRHTTKLVSSVRACPKHVLRLRRSSNLIPTSPHKNLGLTAGVDKHLLLDVIHQ